MNNEQYGDNDLFTYFGGGFVSPKDSSENTDRKVTDNRSIEGSCAEEEKNMQASDACRGLTAEEEDALKDESADTPSDKKEEAKVTFTHSTYICYAGMSKPISKYFSSDQIPLLTLEDVRKRLEKDFPEMSKQRTNMDYDAKKNIIVPVIAKGKKGSGAFFHDESRGYFFSASSLMEWKNEFTISYLAAEDGFYEVRDTSIGVFVSKVDINMLWKHSDTAREFIDHASRVDKLYPCSEGFKFKLPKIPIQMMQQLISLFADYSKKNNGIEVMGVIYWDQIKEKFMLDIPLQEVHKHGIMVDYSSYPHHVIKVMEVHSHNTMYAFFSSIDNEDELGTHLYGVIGNLKENNNNIQFDIKTRAGVAGRFIPIPSASILEGEYEDRDNSWNAMQRLLYPHNWKKQVKIVNGV
ncbi:hypothetical protein QP794_23445 [Paenibacillus sp. UMB7766-LJ446]|uniref:hypothetical protein n=1 Tax=Paenibacillus sp. UMB7766-LJ446 TaxID=3046313 RepID=UPI00254D303D|nr:hypothetical protein [Paenibacillus sp. UMB7766-LJ446]MDK8193049.1 hypothetical protein [Paenibacillus sp. UMB7766-LJ446]